jgi:hypothetical protein
MKSLIPLRILLALLLLALAPACGPEEPDDDDDSGTPDDDDTTDDDDSGTPDDDDATDDDDDSGPDDDDWVEIPETEFDVTYSDPTGVAQWITSGPFSFGFNEDGGGCISCILSDPSAGQPARCDSLAGDPNLVSPGYGRAWQNSFRDNLHSNRYNPTQAGFSDSWGIPAALTLGDSCNGPGGRLYVAPFRLPIYSNHKFDWVENEDIVSDGYADDGDASDNDGIDESGLSQLDEIRSEWNYTAY